MLITTSKLTDDQFCKRSRKRAHFPHSTSKGLGGPLIYPGQELEVASVPSRPRGPRTSKICSSKEKSGPATTKQAQTADFPYMKLNRVPEPNSQVCGVFPTSISNSQIPGGCQLNSNNTYQETEADSTGQELNPTRPPSTSGASRKPSLLRGVVTNWLQAQGFSDPLFKHFTRTAHRTRENLFTH